MTPQETVPQTCVISRVAGRAQGGQGSCPSPAALLGLAVGRGPSSLLWAGLVLTWKHSLLPGTNGCLTDLLLWCP